MSALFTSDESVMTLSDFFPADHVRRNAEFSQLDQVSTELPGSLVYCESLHYLQIAIRNPNVAAVVTTPALCNEANDRRAGLIAAERPALSFFEVYVKLGERAVRRPALRAGRGENCRIHPTSTVSEKARLGNRVEIGPGVVIGDYVDIGDDVFIDANAVVGAEGLFTLRYADGRLLRIRHQGSIQIGSGTQLYSGATIARALYCAPTRIGNHCQIGILSTIGHGVSVGDESVISGNVVIAGRTRVGKNVWMGASSSVTQGVDIGDGAQLKIGSVVTHSLEKGEVVSGNFAVPHQANLRHFFGLKKR